MAVRIPTTAAKLRELLHCAQIVQSHALSFFHLSAPDLLLGMDHDPARRNVVGLLEERPDVAPGRHRPAPVRSAVIERIAARAHPPGLDGPGRRQRAARPGRARADPGRAARRHGHRPANAGLLWKATLDRFPDEIATFSNQPTMYCGLVGPDGSLRLYDGALRFVDSDGAIVADQVAPTDYASWIGEAAVPTRTSRRPTSCPSAIPRASTGSVPWPASTSPTAAGRRWRTLSSRSTASASGAIVQSGFHYHYARLIEAPHGLERIGELLDDPDILSTRVRAQADVNELEGIGVIEAPRGTLIHHYRVDDGGAMRWANLIVATGHNNLAISGACSRSRDRFIDGERIPEGAVNRVSALVRAFDPCLSCSTHTLGQAAVVLQLRGPDGTLLDERGNV